MARQAPLSDEIDRIDRQITALRDYLHDAESYPEQVDLSGRVRRAVSLFLIRRHTARQIQYLLERRRMLHNCYQYTRRRRPGNAAPIEDGPIRTYRP